MPKRKFGPEEQGVSPKTLSDVRPGSAVVVRDAYGQMRSKVATTGVIEGGSFFVVWVARPEEVALAAAGNREPDAVPWPAEDVWVPGDEPGEDGPRA